MTGKIVFCLFHWFYVVRWVGGGGGSKKCEWRYGSERFVVRTTLPAIQSLV